MAVLSLWLNLNRWCPCSLALNSTGWPMAITKPGTGANTWRSNRCHGDERFRERIIARMADAEREKTGTFR